jgi:hypothetical protein
VKYLSVLTKFFILITMKSRIFVYRVCLVLYIALFAHAEKATALGESNWTVSDDNNASFTIGNTAATVTISDSINTNSGSKFYSVGFGGSNFPGSWYTTGPSNTSTGYVFLAVGNQNTNANGSHRITINFNRPVTNPRVHFANLDNGRVNFGLTTKSDGTAVSMTRLSGNYYFEASGTEVNTIQQSANTYACNPRIVPTDPDNAADSNGGCGTLQFNGTYQTLVYTITDVNPATDQGDGYGLGVTIAEDYGDAPISGTAPSGTGTNNYGQASHHVTSNSHFET